MIATTAHHASTPLRLRHSARAGWVMAALLLLLAFSASGHAGLLPEEGPLLAALEMAVEGDGLEGAGEAGPEGEAALLQSLPPAQRRVDAQFLSGCLCWRLTRAEGRQRLPRARQPTFPARPNPRRLAALRGRAS